MRRLLSVFSPGSRTLAILNLGVLLSYSGTGITFPLRLLYAQSHGATSVQLGLMASMILVGPLLLQAPLGWLLDHWGRLPVLLIGLFAHAAVSAVYIVVGSPDVLVLLRFLEGVTLASFQPSVGAYIADVSAPADRGRAYGGLTAALSGGLLIGPLVGGAIGQSAGYTWAFIVSVFIEILAALLVAFFVHEPQRHTTHTESRRADPVSPRSLFSIPLMGVYVATAAGQLVMGAYGAFWTIYVHDIHGSLTYIGFTFAAFAVPMILLSTIAGRLSDRFGRFWLIALPTFPIAAIYLAYGLVTNLIGILVLGIVEGIITTAQGPAVAGLLADAAPPHAQGRAQGIAASMGSFGGIVGAFAALPLYSTNRILVFVMISATSLFGGLAGTLAARAMLSQNRNDDPPTGMPISEPSAAIAEGTILTGTVPGMVPGMVPGTVDREAMATQYAGSQRSETGYSRGVALASKREWE